MVLGPGSAVSATADAASPLQFLLIAGKPINEPVVQHGPFVVNTEMEIHQCFADFQSGKLQRREDNPWTDDYDR